jgi:4-phytase/acid phosphatase/peptide/nickel transport system substrate-binding protein
MDELLLIQQQSVDEKTRRKALCGVANLINEDVMYLYGGGRRFHAIARASVKGIDNFSQGIIRVGESWLNGDEKKIDKVKKKKDVKKAQKHG